MVLKPNLYGRFPAHRIKNPNPARIAEIAGLSLKISVRLDAQHIVSVYGWELLFCARCHFRKMGFKDIVLFIQHLP